MFGIVSLGRNSDMDKSSCTELADVTISKVNGAPFWSDRGILDILDLLHVQPSISPQTFCDFSRQQDQMVLLTWKIAEIEQFIWVPVSTAVAMCLGDPIQTGNIRSKRIVIEAHHVEQKPSAKMSQLNAGRRLHMSNWISMKCPLYGRIMPVWDGTGNLITWSGFNSLSTWKKLFSECIALSRSSPNAQLGVFPPEDRSRYHLSQERHTRKCECLPEQEIDRLLWQPGDVS